MKWFVYSLMVFLSLGFRLPNDTVPSKVFIPWSADKPLTWSDFKAQPVENSLEAAVTSSSIEFTYETDSKNMLRWTVLSKFFPHQSWSKKANQTVSILKHEQVHFDITEIYARLMRKRFSEAIKSVQDIHKFKPIAKQIMIAWNEEQNNYDFETKHSMDNARQQEWNHAVEVRLEALKNYTVTTVTVQK